MPCSGTNASGGACRRPVADGARWCAAHDPDRAEERQLAAEAGGAARGEQIKRARADVHEMELLPWFDLDDADKLEDAHRHVAQLALTGKIGAREAAATNAALRGLRASFSIADAANKMAGRQWERIKREAKAAWRAEWERELLDGESSRG